MDTRSVPQMTDGYTELQTIEATEVVHKFQKIEERLNRTIFSVEIKQASKQHQQKNNQTLIQKFWVSYGSSID